MVKPETKIPILIDIILENIDNGNNFVTDLSEDDFLNDKKTIMATERSIEIIGDSCKEILNRLEKENLKLDNSTVKYLKKVYAARCNLSHGYDNPKPGMVYLIVKNFYGELDKIIRKIGDEL